MDKINFINGQVPINESNMNGMQTNIEKSVTYIGSTQPATNEKVWIKKGNNLYDANTMLEFTGKYRAYDSGNIITSASSNGLKIPTEPNQTYSISNTGSNYHEICYWTKDFTYISGTNGTDEAFTTPANCYITTIQISNTATDIMINIGSTALAYEPYINKEIKIKNDDGVFEEFYTEKKSTYYDIIGRTSIDSRLAVYDSDVIDFNKYKFIVVQIGTGSEGDNVVFIVADDVSETNYINSTAHLDMYAQDTYRCRAFVNLQFSDSKIRITPKQLVGWTTVAVRIVGVLK